MTDVKQDNGFVVFLRKRDIYAQPINLTYNSLKTYPTACGGILSIISTILFLSWFALQLKAIIIYNYNTT